MKYSKWFRYNEERLQIEYDEYFESIDKNFEIPLSFEDYCNLDREKIIEYALLLLNKEFNKH